MLYFEEYKVQERITDFSFLGGLINREGASVDEPHALALSLQQEYIGVGDVRSEQDNPVLNTILRQYPVLADHLHDAVYDSFIHNGHKIGGYASFCQDDPRMYKEGFADYILLLQADSDKKIMWGDIGIANFFIHPDDLAKKDFHE